MAPLTAFVRALEVERGPGMVPWFDPDDAGIKARVLLLFEAPGAKATSGDGPRARQQGSGFVSVDNEDRSAELTWQLFGDVGVNRSTDVVLWNVVPSYVGDTRHIRAVTDRDLDASRPALVRLLELLTELRIVVLVGAKAQRGWLRAQIPFPILAAPAYESARTRQPTPGARHHPLGSTNRPHRSSCPPTVPPHV